MPTTPSEEREPLVDDTTTDRGSAYPGRARRLARKWDKPRVSKGLRGLLGESRRLLHHKSINIQIEQRRGEIRFLIMLSTMRSGSSMLSQILCSHREVFGFGETHIEYTGDESFVSLIQRNAWDLKAWRLPRARFFDKVLHAELIPDMRLLSQMPVDWLVLVRGGAPCVKSMIRTLGMTPKHACAYFEQHWECVDRWSKELMDWPSSRVTVVRYEDLIEDPDSALALLSSDLGLSPVLSPDYSVQRGTKRAGAADPSGEYLRGKIARIEHDDAPLPPDVLSRLEERDRLNSEMVDRIRNRN